MAKLFFYLVCLLILAFAGAFAFLALSTPNIEQNEITITIAADKLD